MRTVASVLTAERYRLWAESIRRCQCSACLIDRFLDWANRTSASCTASQHKATRSASRRFTGGSRSGGTSS